jgi:hypothetical protein
MARVCTDLDVIPGLPLFGHNITMPVDLPEGGILMVVVGDNPVAVPTMSVTLPRGCKVAVVPPEMADQMRPQLNAALEQIARQRARANGNGGPGRIIGG